MSGMERSRESFPEEWSDALVALEALPHGSVCLVTGMPDRGRTAFVVLAAGILSDNGARVAVIDADIANSELSYPGTVAVAWAAPHFDRLQEMTSVTAFFVGSFSVGHVALEFTAALVRAVSWARSAGAARVIVDLPTLVSSASNRRLMATLAQCLSPDLILGFSGEAELPDILAIASLLGSGATLSMVRFPETIGRSSEAQRSLRRGVRLSRAVGDGPELRLPITPQGTTSAYTLNTSLGTAPEVQPHLLRWISQTLRCNVVRAELNKPRQIDIYIRESQGTSFAAVDVDTAIIAEHFGVRSVRQIRLSQIFGMYVGLINQNGKLVGVGRFAGIHGATQEMRIVTAASASHQIRVVQFGRARIGLNGEVNDEFQGGNV